MFKKSIHLKAFQCCGEKLKSRGLTLAFAESMTAGYISSIFSQGIYASDYFMGSIVAYNNQVKTALLGVKPQTIAQYTAESIATSTAMLEGLKKHIDADIHIAITGLAYQGGSENKFKPVGSVFISICFQGVLSHHTYRFKGSLYDIHIATLNIIISEILLLLEEPYLKEE